MEPPTVATGDWDYFRRQMPIARQWAYFDHAAVAPLSGPAHQCLTQWATDAVVDGSAHYPAWSRQIEHVRTLAADMIGAAPEEIALIGNTTAGINLVAEGFPWKPGDNVVIREDEFSLESVPLAPLGGPWGGDPPYPHQRRAARPGSAGRRLRPPHADR